MKTMKFGGTSLETAEKFLQVSSIIVQNIKKKKISVVLSAPAKITNLLINSINHCKQKDSDITEIIQEIKLIIKTLLKNITFLEKKFKYIDIKKKIKKKFDFLKKSLQGIKLLQTNPEKITAKIISLGEWFSVFIMQEILNTKNYSSKIINPVKYFLATGSVLNAVIDLQESKNRISKINFYNTDVILMPGFIAGNIKNEQVILGRNGSDYSAAALSVCLSSKICEIWTDVNGIYTCDPRKIPHPILLEKISYQEAIELAYYGATVLHAKTIYPLQKKLIPCVVKNTYNPTNPGTLIDNIIHQDNLPITGITILNNIAVINIFLLKKNYFENYLKKIKFSIEKNNINVITLNYFDIEGKIIICIQKNFLKKIISNLEKIFAWEIEKKLIKLFQINKDLNLITIVDKNIKKNNTFIIKKFFSALNIVKGKLFSIVYNNSNISISFAIYNKNNDIFLQTLHDFIFSTYKYINLFLIGIGGIGQSLLNQIEIQKKYLLERNIKINLNLLANSKMMLYDSNSINVTTWKNDFKHSKNSFCLKKILNMPKEFALINPVLVDCTASENFTKNYIDIIKNGFHIVSANKKSNTLPMLEYQKIREITKKYNKKFFYETHVGAGLPVIKNLQNLLSSGDSLIKFKGILSGSMSFIFGKLDKNILLSEATKKAKNLGFTEPNPKDDLSGKDVARKLLILARESGINIELKDIYIEKILPKNFKFLKHNEEFWTELKKIDSIFIKRVQQAKQGNKVLRFVGIITEEGKCSVKICNVDKSDPLYEIRNGENVLVFYTKYYNPVPLILRGYGAGNNVTASGIFSDLLRILP